MNVENYNKVFNKFPPLVSTDRWVYGVWMIGNDYRCKNNYYGQYPPSYLKRVHALFPHAQNVLHLFSGVVEKGFWLNEIKLDINQDLHPDVVADATNLPFLEKFDIVLADPPYSHEDAKKYNCKMPNRKKTIHEVYKVLRCGGYLVWLDTVLPMYRKIEFKLVGTIGLIRSTNHRIRGVFIFQKQ
jgi:hypothetical protein